jgi:hypothetical protein
MSVSFQTLLSSLSAQPGGGDNWRSTCPAHADSSPSFSIGIAPGGGLWFHCFAGCSQRAVVDALQERDLWPVDMGRGTPYFRASASTDHKIRISSYARPSDVGALRPSHRAYLAQRGFDPDRLISEWGIGSTGPTAALKGIEYKNRIFIPITWGGREISFTTRVVGDAEQRYKSCAEAYEEQHHKSILYTVGSERLGICVEGPTDAWRLGPLAFATLGTKYTHDQLLAMSERYDRIAIAFDGDRAGRKQAAKLHAQLRSLGVGSTIIKLGPGVDPGGLSADDAAELVKQTRRGW